MVRNETGQPFGIADVVSGGFCVGCGACAARIDRAVMMSTALGTFEPDLSAAPPEDLALASAVCPFSDASPDETALGKRLYEGKVGHHSPQIGYYSQLGAAAITDDGEREWSSSGGLTNWVLHKLLESGRVAGVIHVGANAATENNLFSFSISRSVGELYAQRKSKYYVAEISEAFASIRDDGQSYAFVGVPCFITAARHLTQTDPHFSHREFYFVGLVCGHLKSTRFAELMAWQLGIPPDDLQDVDFRKKVPNLPAGGYHFAAQSRSTRDWRSAPAVSLYGGDWGHAFFQLKSCDYCDDVFVEGADIAFGDAWLPQYEDDWLGTNVVVSRTALFDDMIRDGIAANEIRWDALPEQALVASQGGNFRHRRDGLSLRLADAKAKGERVPRKRVSPGSIRLPKLRKRIVRLRQKTASKSHDAFARARDAGDLAIFVAEMTVLTREVAKTYRLMRLMSWRGLKDTVRRIVHRVSR